MTEIFGLDCIIVEPEAEDRASVFKALVKLLSDTGKINISQAGTAARLLNEREAVGSTAIGGGVALPHARVKFSDKVLGALALLKKGAGFNALDGGPVRYVFLLLTPKDDDALHIATLKAITQFTRDHTHLKALSGCKTPEAVHGVLRDYS